MPSSNLWEFQKERQHEPIRRLSLRSRSNPSLHGIAYVACGGAGMRITAAEFRQQAKPSKYRNEPVMIDGIRFDSKAEARYYSLLKLREKAGEVHGVELQKPFAITIDGKLICTYRSDFYFFDHVERRTRIIDVKGVITPVFRLKAKLVKAFYGMDIEVVK